MDAKMCVVYGKQQISDMKTPVSILNELLHRCNITPDYELLQVEGELHKPIFKFRVSFKDNDTLFAAIGTGSTKMEAKHAAARTLMDKLNGVQLSSAMEFEAAADNPIGWLQELCVQRQWPPPSYEMVLEAGELFSTGCSVLNYRVVGKGKSKKISKRWAAHKMLTLLKNINMENEQIYEGEESRSI